MGLVLLGLSSVEIKGFDELIEVLSLDVTIRVSIFNAENLTFLHETFLGLNFGELLILINGVFALV